MLETYEKNGHLVEPRMDQSLFYSTAYETNVGSRGWIEDDIVYARIVAVTNTRVILIAVRLKNRAKRVCREEWMDESFKKSKKIRDKVSQVLIHMIFLLQLEKGICRKSKWFFKKGITGPEVLTEK